jgi:hypothetical protein
MTENRYQISTSSDRQTLARLRRLVAKTGMSQADVIRWALITLERGLKDVPAESED